MLLQEVATNLITPRYPDKKRGYQLKSYLRLMTENFAQLFEESLQELETRPGSIVKGVKKRSVTKRGLSS